MAEDDLFPIIEDLEEAEFLDSNLEEDFIDEEVEAPLPYGFTWKFDFTQGDIYTDAYGRMVQAQGQDCLREWLAHVLSTERFETTIFGGDIGTSLNDILGRHQTMDAQTIALVEAEIREAIQVHDRIEAVEKIAVIPLDYDMFVYMRYVTDDSVTIEEVAAF